MARITNEGLEACLAFGIASTAVMLVGELMTQVQAGRPALDLFVGSQLPTHGSVFSSPQGHDDALCALAQKVLELAKRTEDALNLNKDTNRSCD